MAQRGKKYRAALAQVDRNKQYDLLEACTLVKNTSYSKMDASVDLAVNLGVDPRHADQNIRGATVLPHGLGKKVRIVVFAKGEKAVEANNLKVEFVGGDDLAKKIQDGWDQASLQRRRADAPGRGTGPAMTASMARRKSVGCGFSSVG